MLFAKHGNLAADWVELSLSAETDKVVWAILVLVFSMAENSMGTVITDTGQAAICQSREQEGARCLEVPKHRCDEPM